MNGLRFTFCLLFAASLAASARANKVTVELPLGERYRVGRCFPVRINSVGNPERVTIEAAGAVTTELTVAGPASDVVVPVLALERIGPLQVRESGQADANPLALSPVPDDSRLVGVSLASTSDASVAALTSDIFPGRAIVTVSLDSSNPLRGPAIAWGALDTIVLDVSSAARVTDAQLRTLFAGGTAVAVHTDASPLGGGENTWRQHAGGWWIAVPPPHASIDPQLPFESPGRSAAYRRTVVLILLAFCIAAAGASMLRSRRGWLAVPVVAVVASVVLILWNRSQPVTAITVDRFGDDRLITHVAVADGETRQPIVSAGVTLPVVSSAVYAREVSLRMICAEDGRPVEYRANLRRGQAIRFIDRAP